MIREWAPGDVATVTFSDKTTARAVRNHANNGWMHNGEWGEGGAFDSIGGVTDARPLVVLDSEDREQVVGLCAALGSADARRCAHTENVQAALRSLLAPPKPDEPEGLGAVVEDAEGKRRWVRVDRVKGFEWIPTPIPPNSGERPTARPAVPWSDVPAVRVLSPGVTP